MPKLMESQPAPAKEYSVHVRQRHSFTVTAPTQGSHLAFRSSCSALLTPRQINKKIPRPKRGSVVNLQQKGVTVLLAIDPFANQENLLELNRYGVMQPQVAGEESTSEVPLDTNMYAPTSIVTLYKSRTPAQETIVRYRPPMPQSLTCMPNTPLPIHHHHRSTSPQDKLPVLLAPSSSSTSLTPHHPIPGLGSSNPTTLSPNSAFSSSISTILKQLGRREDPALVFPKEEKLPLRAAKLPLRAKKFKLLVLVEKLWASISAREEVGIWEQAERKEAVEEEEGEREGRMVVLLLLVVEVEVEGANGSTFWKMARDWRRWGEVVVIVVE